LGYRVYAFEPSPLNHKHLINILKLNRCKNITPIKKAFSKTSGFVEFVSVKDNMTASHISGSRKFYGDIEKEKVMTISFNDCNVIPDFMKIDVEGHESDIVCSISHSMWENIDSIIEIHSEDNARKIFDYFYNKDTLTRKNKSGIFAHKTLWKELKSFEDMPKNNKEGNIFISSNIKMSWK
jgi:FkbM family methyltransferase